jgi:transposase
MTIPGVGPVTSLAFKATIDEVGRFGTSRALGAHLGLTPRVYQSGEIDRSGHISKCGDRMLLHLLYEAASALMTRTRKWSRLRAWGVAIAKRRGIKRATVAVARKLAVIMHRIWITGEFEFGNPAAAANAAYGRPSAEPATAGARPSRTPGTVKSVKVPVASNGENRSYNHVL